MGKIKTNIFSKNISFSSIIESLPSLRLKMPSLFKRLGGKSAVNAVVDRFYEYMLNDERVNHFFTKINMEKQRQHQRHFMTFAFGGDVTYDGQDMRSAHQVLVEKKGLSDVHFDATVENLENALKDFNVTDDLISEVKNIVEGVRTDVLLK